MTMDGPDNNHEIDTLCFIAQLLGCSSNFRGKRTEDQRRELAGAFAKLLPIQTIKDWQDAQVCGKLAEHNKEFGKYEFDREYADFMMYMLAHKFENAHHLFEFGPRIVDPISDLYHKGDNENRVLFYEQQYYVLSNFSSFQLHWRGYLFHTSEAAYHWEKFKGPTDRHVEAQQTILDAPSAHEALQVARRAEQEGLRIPEWDDIKVNKMYWILRAKVDQHEYVKRQLLATGDRELIEDSWRDSFWGWGADQQGQNQLGQLWMQIRAELRESTSTTGVACS
jgi:ribA/ribD-fused uncharacterized protein